MDQAPSGLPSLAGLESSLPLSDQPCLIVEDSQPDSLAIEDDPENSYRALLSKRFSMLTTLPPRQNNSELELISCPIGRRSSHNNSQSQFSVPADNQSQASIPEMNPSFEDSEILDVSDKRSRSDDMDSRADSQRLTHEEGASQFGFLELSQSQDFGAAPGQDQSQSRTKPDETWTSPKSQSRAGPPVSVDVLLHSQNQDQGQKQEELLSSQQDLFDKTGAAPEPVVMSCTPSRSLALLHLSGGVQGTLVNNSLSQGSVDFVAPTPDNFTPMIVPSSPTELPPHADEATDSSLPPTGQSEHKEPGPAYSTPVSQNTPGFELERPLSVPSQPDFSHDVFVPTQSQDSSRTSHTLKPSVSATSVFSESSLNLCINTELQDDDEEATQIEQMDETSPQKSAINPENSQHIQGVTNQADKLSAGSQNNLRMSSQEVKKLPEKEKQAISNHGSQECPMKKTYNAHNEPKWSQGSTKANSQPIGSVTGSMVKEGSVLGSSQDKLTSQESRPTKSVTGTIVNEEAVAGLSEVKKGAKANSQPTGSVSEVLKGEYEGKVRNISLSQPAKSMTDMTAKNEAISSTSQTKRIIQGSSRVNSQSAGSVTDMIVNEEAVLSSSHPKRMCQESTKVSDRLIGVDIVRTSQSHTLNENNQKGPWNSSGSGGSPSIGAPGSGVDKETSLGLGQSQSQTSTPGNRGDGEGGGKMSVNGRDKGEASGVKSLDSSGDISFHFTLPKGELIGPSVSATPPQISQLKQSVRHSTPIEISSLSQKSDVSVGSVAESGDGPADGADGKLSLRMKLVTPVEEGSERFSLQRPVLTEDNPAGPKSTTKNSNSGASVFSRVRQVHRQQEDTALRSPLFSSPQRNSADCNSLPNSQSDDVMQDVTSQPHISVPNDNRGENPSLPTPGAASNHDKSDPETPAPRGAGPAHRRHVRTVQEVRTTVTRIITDVYYEDGKEVERTVVQESDEPVVHFQVMDVSPSQTGRNSMTSGDLADISSSTCTTGTSSTTGPTTGTIDRHDFLLPPPSRGAKASRVPPAALVPDQDSVSDSAGSPPGTPSGSGSSFVGLRVVAKWSSNGYFYSGRIIADRGIQRGLSESGASPGSGAGAGENRFRLRFDDGYECELWARDILLCDPIPLETEVTALNQDQTYTTGVVKAHRVEGSELQYCVQRGEQRLWFSRGSVILSLDQGNRLREHHSLGPYHPPPTLGKAADISLDNLVEGKRKRRVGLSGLNTPTRSPRVRTKPSADLSPGSSPGPSPGSKRKLGPVQSPAAKKGRRGAVQQVSVLNTSDSDPPLVACDHAPCHSSCELIATHGPRPQNHTLFEGFVFLLTASSEQDRLSNRDDSDDELVQSGPYNKAYTESQLQSGGGIILKEFNHQQCEAAYQSLLVADQHCRNRKYLLCVASGVPCVSHLWVRDCCRDNSLHNYRNYLLPAGAGPEGRVREWRPRCSPFKSLRILLLLEEQLQFWSELVQLGGGTVLVWSPQDQSELPAADVLVLEPGLDPGLVSALALPRVSVDWILNSVVCGETVDFSSALDSSS